MNENLEKLRKLTPNLPPIPKMGDYKHSGETCTEYTMNEGTCISWGLLSKPETSVALTFLSSGGKTPHACVDEKEYIVVVKGVLILGRGEEGNIKKKTLHTGDCTFFTAGEKHSIRALEDVLIIGVTIPFSKHFPKSSKLPDNE